MAKKKKNPNDHMRVAIVAEGCYPYVVGGVSSWVHSVIQSFPNVEFVVVAIVANRSLRGKFVYDMLPNVTEVRELYLEDYDWYLKKPSTKRFKVNKEVYGALESLVLNKDVQWDPLFHFFSEEDFSLNDLLMGEDFLNVAKDAYYLQYNQCTFADFLWTIRSIYLPLFLTMKLQLPEADLYHCVATGYAGVIGSMAKVIYDSGLLVSEHGIYSREREEELIKAKWVKGIYKNIWIDQFKKMSIVAYNKADKVTSLYEYARELQIELGCPEVKTEVTPNGINTQNFADLPGKTAEDGDFINIGAVLRITPIKDVKTMIRAFAFAKEKQPKLKLWLMGPDDEDPEYAKECFDMVENLKIPDVVFTGRINVREYLGRMDATILTSISEGQPLTILEGYAAHKPTIATDVGNCRGLIYGEGSDKFGPAGILTHIMNVEEVAQAMIDIANKPEQRYAMGEAGYQRVMARYRIEHMKATYREIYENFAAKKMVMWTEEVFDVRNTSEGQKALEEGKKAALREKKTTERKGKNQIKQKAGRG
ncbi:glycosyl transferase [Clostridia bacterium]|nr:glycosyl transferase [Clostridia bacterium]